MRCKITHETEGRKYPKMMKFGGGEEYGIIKINYNESK